MNEVRMRRPSAPAPEWAKSYRGGDYPPFAYAADIVRLSIGVPDGRLLIHTVTRGQEPYAGKYAYPGGFVDWLGDQDAHSAALRECVEEAGLGEPDYMETLDTYDKSGRDPRQFTGFEDGGSWVATGVRVVSKAHLALDRSPARGLAAGDASREQWLSVYDFFPWEDLRAGAGAREKILSQLFSHGKSLRGQRREVWETRLAGAFGEDASAWNEERVRERFDLIVEAGLAEEAHRDIWGAVVSDDAPGRDARSGLSMAFDHRWMLADALGRLRGKIKWMPRVLASLTCAKEFTIYDIQMIIESVSGRSVHQGNLRRVLRDTARIIEPTGEAIDRKSSSAGPSPARVGPLWKTYRFVGALQHVRLDPSIRFPFTCP